jgi:hypothetical protein
LTEWSGGHTNWKQTSYNGSFRYNFATTTGTYDPDRDAFLYPKPYESWVLNEETCLWRAPINYPTDGNDYAWFEEESTWIRTNE